MRFGDALKEALKYHAIAIIPTLIGVVIAFGSLWIGVIDPFLEAIAGELGEPTVALERAFEAEYGLGIAVFGVVAGLLIRRIGRTAILFRTHGNAIIEEVDTEVIPEAIADETSAADDDPTGGPSDRYDADPSESAAAEEPSTAAHDGEDTPTEASTGTDVADDGDEDGHGGDEPAFVDEGSAPVDEGDDATPTGVSASEGVDDASSGDETDDTAPGEADDDTEPRDR